MEFREAEMSETTKEEGGGRLVRFPHYDLDAAVEVLGAFITSGIRDDMEMLRRDVEALKEKFESVVTATESEPEEDRFLNQRDAAEFLGCSTTYLRKQLQLGEFPNPIKLSDRDLRWSRLALKQWAVGRRSEAIDS